MRLSGSFYRDLLPLRLLLPCPSHSVELELAVQLLDAADQSAEQDRELLVGDLADPGRVAVLELARTEDVLDRRSLAQLLVDGCHGGDANGCQRNPSSSPPILLAVTDLRLLKAELEALVLACADMRSADVMCRLLLDPFRKQIPVPGGATVDEIRDGLWTAAVVSYRRPFGSSRRRVDPVYELFDDADLNRLHREIKGLRDQLFAHTDDFPLREVVIRPPKTARERRVRFERIDQPASLRKLCQAQLERMDERAQQIVSYLSDAADLEPGAEIAISDVPDESVPWF
jgi:hypothetical protein